MKKEMKISIIGVTFLFLLTILVTPLNAINTKNKEPSTDIVIEECWNQYNDQEFRDILVDMKVDLKEAIEELPEEKQYWIRRLLNSEEAFDLANIKGQILKLRLGHVVEDVQSLMLQPDGKEDFLETHEQAFHDFYNLGKGGFLNILGDYEIIDEICQKIGDVARRWMGPMIFLFGVRGIAYSCLITLTLFSPILAPCWIYVALSETLLHYPDLRQELEEMGPIEFLEEGIYKLRDHCYMGNWLAKAGLYILKEILLDEGNLAHGEPYYSFGETKPEHMVDLCQVDKKKNSLRITVKMGDEDKALVVKGMGPSWDYRDWVQLGFDWNGDEDIDEWTKLLKRDYQTVICYIIENHKWDDGTEQATIGVVSRDNWGVRGDYETLHISFERNIQFPKGIFFIGRCHSTNAPHGPHIASNYDIQIIHTGTTRFGLSIEDYETGETSVSYWDKGINEENTIHIDSFSGFLTHRTLLRFVIGWGTCTNVIITTQKSIPQSFSYR